jgi:hypothetical protein
MSIGLLVLLLLLWCAEGAVVTRYLIEYSFFDNKAAVRDDDSDIVVYPESVRLAPVQDPLVPGRAQLPLTIPSAGLPPIIPGGPPTANLRVRIGADEVNEFNLLRQKKKKKTKKNVSIFFSQILTKYHLPIKDHTQLNRRAGAAWRRSAVCGQRGLLARPVNSRANELARL